MPYSNIDKPSSYFNTKLYTGNGGSSQSITGVGFQPDLVWIKDRPLGFDHNLFDSVRGIYNALNSNTDYAENFGQGSNTDSLTSFDSDGFSVGGDDALNDPYTYVSWNWKANGTGVSNTAGSISSTVSANTTSGFSIVSWTGNGSSSATVGHGLGVTPSMIINKSRSASGAWFVYHKGLSANNFLYFNYNDAQSATSGTGGGALSTSPTSSTFGFTAGSSSVNNVNTNGRTYVTYCFADVKGYSKFGSYVGNGNSDGTFVYTGMRPAFVMIKRTDVTDQWYIIDNKRSSINSTNHRLFANLSDAESTGSNIDILSNGFKSRTSDATNNASGGSYIYMAFAENPFVSSKSIPTTAR
jgi:hypothetical protein